MASTSCANAHGPNFSPAWVSTWDGIGAYSPVERALRLALGGLGGLMRVGSGMRIQDSDISTQCHDWVYLTANSAVKYTQ